jgi:hypothetical protein
MSSASESSESDSDENSQLVPELDSIVAVQRCADGMMADDFKLNME